MEKLTLDLPVMYGDHHVSEVRDILGALPGVTEIYASAAWRKVELEYDAGQTNPEAIEEALQARGYSTTASGLPPVSARTVATTDFAGGPGVQGYAAVEQFTEHVPTWGAPLGPCPGFEVRQPGEVHPADQ